MTVLEVMLTIALAVTVPGVVWLAVDTWALRRDVDRLDREARGLSAHDDLSDKYHHSWGRQLWDHHLRIAALEDAHDTTTDLDVPHVDDHSSAPDDPDPDAPTTPVYRPVPADFNEWR